MREASVAEAFAQPPEAAGPRRARRLDHQIGGLTISAETVASPAPTQVVEITCDELGPSVPFACGILEEMSASHRIAGVIAAIALVMTACGESTRTAPVAPVETVVVPTSTAPAQPTTPLPPPDDPKPPSGPTTILVPLDDGPSPPAPSPWPPAPNGNCAPFDRGAAATALASVNVQACARPGGIRGAGHVKLTYAPSGHVTAVVVDGGPYPGTPEAACITAKYRGAQVPPFCVGAAVSIGKSFALN
ncbi:MAG: virulence associated protein [Labilithrix sp.]|nr:virulence associated protein [Labilithrix sp.]